MRAGRGCSAEARVDLLRSVEVRVVRWFTMPMRRPPTAKTASFGVRTVKEAIEGELDWLFREQATEDYGIDAQAELVEGGVVEGRLLALQIKSGASWFGEVHKDGWWYRPNRDHVEYWMNHSLPVIIVLVQPATGDCHWQRIDAETLTQTATGGWKVLVPANHVLDRTAREPLREAAQGDPYELRVRELRLARPWMDLLEDGVRLVVDIEEWVNKTSGRGSIVLGVDAEDGEDPTALAEWGVFLGLSTYAEAIPRMFAWAAVSVHEETYDESEQEDYESECVFYDEGDRLTTRGYNEWRTGRSLDRLRPYTNVAGEVDHWRLELSLNELGKAFLIVDEFAQNGRTQLI